MLLKFEDVFPYVANDRLKTIFDTVQAEYKNPQIESEEYAKFHTGARMNMLFNITLTHYLAETVLYDLTGLFSAAKVTDKLTQNNIVSLFVEFIKANQDTLMNIDEDTYFLGTSLTNDGKLIVDFDKVLSDYTLHYEKLRSHIFVAVTEQYSSFVRDQIKKECSALEEVYKQMKTYFAKADMPTYEEVEQICKAAETLTGATKIFERFHIIIDYMKSYGFHSGKFTDVLLYRVQHMSIDDIEVQERYLRKVIPLNKNHSANLASLTAVFDQYRKTMAEMKKENERLETEIKDKYEKYHESVDVDSEIMSAINMYI